MKALIKEGQITGGYSPAEAVFAGFRKNYSRKKRKGQIDGNGSNFRAAVRRKQRDFSGEMS